MEQLLFDKDGDRIKELSTRINEVKVTKALVEKYTNDYGVKKMTS